MTIIEQLKADIAHNSTHILFTMEDDETMGKREQGFYTKFIMDNGHQCRRFIFDNGHRYLLDIEEETLYPCEPVPEEYFIHKYIEKLISDFASKWQLTSSNIKTPMYCAEDEIDAMPLIRLLPFRNEKIVRLPNIMMPIEFRHKGIGKQLIAQIYEICKHFDYRLILVDVVESFSNSLRKRNAKFLDIDTIEITQDTNLD